MSAKNTVDVKITATADGSALDKFAKSQDAVSTAIKGTRAAADAVEAPIEKIGKAAGKAAGKKGAGGMGLLQIAQAADDVQGGVEGMMQNLPALVMAFGGGTVAADALALAIQAVSAAFKMLGEQTDDGQSDKLLGALTPSDEALARMDKFTASLKAQADEYERLRNTRKLMAEDAKAETEHAEKKAKIVNAGSAPDPLALVNEFEAGGIKRKAELNAGKENVTAAVGRVSSLDAQTMAQEKIVNDTVQRSLLAKQLSAAKDIVAQRAGHDAAMEARRANPSQFQTPAPEAPVSAESARNAAAEVQSIQEKMKGLAMPAVSQPLTGNGEKDFEILTAALAAEKERLAILKEQRLEAAQKARAEAESLMLLERKLGREQELATLNLQSGIAKETGRAAALPELGEAPPMLADFGANTAKLEAVTQQLAVQRDSGMSALLAGLTDYVTAAGAEFGALRAKVGTLQAATDQLRNKAKGGQ
jgi:hypothetical protein